MAGEKCRIHEILEVLIEGKFYRKLKRENQLMFVGNSKSTNTNILCIVAGLLAFASGKLKYCFLSYDV